MYQGRWVGTTASLLAMAAAPLAAAGALCPRVPIEAYFEPNVGQADDSIRFVRRNPDHTLLVTNDSLVLVAPGEGSRTIRLIFEGAVAVDVNGVDPLPARSEHCLGDSSQVGRRSVPGFGQVESRGLYPGIDLVLHAADDASVEYDFRLAPRA